MFTLDMEYLFSGNIDTLGHLFKVVRGLPLKKNVPMCQYFQCVRLTDLPVHPTV